MLALKKDLRSLVTDLRQEFLNVAGVSEFLVGVLDMMPDGVRDIDTLLVKKKNGEDL